MMNTFKMKNPIITILGLIFTFFIAQAQEKTIDPELLSVWSPIPTKVTPGENNAPPSDAIVLFDGKDLNEWTNSNGGAAKWTVEGNAMTVKAGTGAVKTKQKFGDFQLHI